MSLIREDLFSEGGRYSGRPGLAEALESHKRATLDRIIRTQNIDQMTEDFIARLVRDSLVQPPILEFENMTHELRTEQISKSIFPMEFHFHDRHGTFPKQVARISISFTGERDCFRYAATTFGTDPPCGRVSGGAIQFDVVFWGYSDDEERVERRIKENCEKLRTYTGYAINDVKKFNLQLPEVVETAFRKRIDEFTKQTSFLSNLGIKPASLAPPNPPRERPSNPPSKSREPKQAQIIQYIQAMYVQQLNQTNNNEGNVNNAIQSD